MTDAEHKRITDLEQRLADTERRIAELYRESFGRWPNNWPRPIDDDPLPGSDDARCAICGNRYKDMTHYVCSHPRCPSQITCGDTPFKA